MRTNELSPGAVMDINGRSPQKHFTSPARVRPRRAARRELICGIGVAMNGRRWHRMATIAAAMALVVFAGCQEGPQSRLAEGKVALASGDYDGAEQHFEQVLEADPELTEARRLKAMVHVETGEFEVAEQILVELWDEQPFDNGERLSVEQRQMRQLLRDQFGELYLRWASSIDPVESPERFESIVRTGLDRSQAHGPLGQMLVEFYRTRADRYVERGEPIRAAEMLERLEQLDRSDARDDSLQRAHRLRREAFERAALERFEQQLKPTLVENDQYDPEEQRLRLPLEYTPDERLDENAEAVENARNEAIAAALPALFDYVETLADIETRDVVFDDFELPAMTLVEERVRRYSYEGVVSFNREDLMELTFQYSQAVRTGRLDEATEPSRPLTEVVEQQLELDTESIDGN